MLHPASKLRLSYTSFSPFALFAVNSSSSRFDYQLALPCFQVVCGAHCPRILAALFPRIPLFPLSSFLRRDLLCAINLHASCCSDSASRSISFARSQVLSRVQQVHMKTHTLLSSRTEKAASLLWRDLSIFALSHHSR